MYGYTGFLVKLIRLIQNFTFQCIYSNFQVIGKQFAKVLLRLQTQNPVEVGYLIVSPLWPCIIFFVYLTNSLMTGYETPLYLCWSIKLSNFKQPIPFLRLAFCGPHLSTRYFPRPLSVHIYLHTSHRPLLDLCFGSAFYSFLLWLYRFALLAKTNASPSIYRPDIDCT